MSDVMDQAPKKEISHEDAMIKALAEALKNTTPERPGAPWDRLDEDKDPEEQAIWIPEGE